MRAYCPSSIEELRQTLSALKENLARVEVVLETREVRVHAKTPEDSFSMLLNRTASSGPTEIGARIRRGIERGDISFFDAKAWFDALDRTDF